MSVSPDGNVDCGRCSDGRTVLFSVRSCTSLSLRREATCQTSTPRLRARRARRSSTTPSDRRRRVRHDDLNRVRRWHRAPAGSYGRCLSACRGVRPTRREGPRRGGETHHVSPKPTPSGSPVLLLRGTLRAWPRAFSTCDALVQLPDVYRAPRRSPTQLAVLPPLPGHAHEQRRDHGLQAALDHPEPQLTWCRRRVLEIVGFAD